MASSLLSDILTFAWSMVRKLSGYITGGVVIDAVSVYERITRHTVSLDSVYVGLGAFVIVPAFAAWREQYQAATDLSHPFHLRERLDAITKQGQSIFDQWIAGKNPKYPSKRWIRDSEKFVAQNFSLEQFDWFKRTKHPEAGERVKISMDLHGHKSREVATDSAYLIISRLAVLSNLRERIKDQRS